MVNVVYYAPPELYLEESLEEIALALAMEGHGVLFCGEGRKYDFIFHDDIIYANKAVRIPAIEDGRKVLFSTNNALIYDARTRDLTGEEVVYSEKQEMRLERDLDDMISMSFDQPVAIFLDAYNPKRILDKIDNSDIVKYSGNFLFMDGVGSENIVEIVKGMSESG